MDGPVFVPLGGSKACATVPAMTCSSMTDLPWPEFGVMVASLSMLTTAEEYSSHFQAPVPGEVDFPNEWLVSTSAFDPFPGSSMFIAAVEVTGDCDLTVEIARSLPGPTCETFETPLLHHAASRFDAPFGPLVENLALGSVESKVDCEAEGKAEFEPCTQVVPCAPGLLCAGLTRAASGMCMDADLRGKFDSLSALPIVADSDTIVELEATGLASVDMDVIVVVDIDHLDPASLTITLTNPSNNEVMVWDHEAGPTAYPWINFDGGLEIRRVPLGFSGDESVNGTWTLKITDAGGGGGQLLGWSVEIMSRWD